MLPGRVAISLFPSDSIGRMVDVSTDSTRMSAIGFGGDVSSVTFRWVARGALVLCASAALIFGLAGATVAAPAIGPAAGTPPAGPAVDWKDLIERCHDHHTVTTADADL